MSRAIFIVIVLLSSILVNISSIFGDDCLYDFDGDGVDEDYTHNQLNHICKKVSSNFCYFPKTDDTLAPHISKSLPEINTLPNTKFSSKYGGCSLSLSGGVLSTGFVGHKYIGFTNFCGVGGFEFGTNVNYRYLLYRKDDIVMMGAELGEKVLGALPFEKEKFRDSVEGGGNFLERGIYTLRVRAEIKDDKCSGRPERDIYPINVFTNLDLDLKLNNAGRIVYDDEETQKIEIVPGQDRFYFNGRLMEIDKDGLGDGVITIKESS